MCAWWLLPLHLPSLPREHCQSSHLLPGPEWAAWLGSTGDCQHAWNSKGSRNQSGDEGKSNCRPSSKNQRWGEKEQSKSPASRCSNQGGKDASTSWAQSRQAPRLTWSKWVGGTDESWKWIRSWPLRYMWKTFQRQRDLESSLENTWR